MIFWAYVTALHLAAYGGHTDVDKLLLQVKHKKITCFPIIKNHKSFQGIRVSDASVKSVIRVCCQVHDVERITQWGHKLLVTKSIPIEQSQIWRSWDSASLMYYFKYNQQDATLYNILYYCQCCTCFGRFICPSSGTQNCTHTTWYMSSLLAATASVGGLELQFPIHPR